MSKLIRYRVKGIKCDNPKCDYRDDSVRLRDYAKWLNRPCPKCGRSLLTQADLDAVRTMGDAVGVVNAFGAVLGLRATRRIPVRIEMNGTGFEGMKVRRIE